MTVHSAVLFVHLVGALLLFAAFALEWMSLRNLRLATAVQNARIWLQASTAVLPLHVLSLLAILIPGGLLAARMHAWDYGWIRLSFVVLLLIGLVAILTGLRTRTLRREVAENTGGGMSASLRDRLRDPLLLVSLRMRVWLALGVVLLMAGKPTDFAQALLIVGVAGAVGLAVALPACFGDGRVPAEGSL